MRVSKKGYVPNERPAHRNPIGWYTPDAHTRTRAAQTLTQPKPEDGAPPPHARRGVGVVHANVRAAHPLQVRGHR
jgi:hypothetical protein